ncbi:hypothetical protein ACFRU3_32555 [Streptomyces sp. NPDC056910]|uniref:hypothetical protein n=1 Tax=Streptomyces sp. NPDC056910 TaxID=3345964 RepID=UPI0036C3FAF6
MPRLTLADLYLHHSVLAPDTETEAYLTQIDAWLGKGRRRKKGNATWSKGGLRVTIHHYDALPQDEGADRDIPPGFRSVDVVILSDEFEVRARWDSFPGGPTGLGAPWTGRRVPGARSVDVPGGRLAGALCRYPQGPSVRRLHWGRLTRLRRLGAGLIRAGRRGRLRWRDG